MHLDLGAYERAAQEGTLNHSWHNCMLAVAVGTNSIHGCVTKGWPRWLAEVGLSIFDRAPVQNSTQRGNEFLHAVLAGMDRGANFDHVYRQWRLDSILPIALAAIGDGDEAWRAACRNTVQSCIDNGGARFPGSASIAAGAAVATKEPSAANAALAAQAAAAAGADFAARAAWAAGTRKADAWDRIEQSLYEILRGEK